MQIAITGSSGLIGRAVAGGLRGDGHGITRVVRSRSAAVDPDAVFWSPAAGEIDASGLAGHDAIINLAGENIFGVWTEAKKARMYHSRVDGTRLMAETVAGMEDTVRPRVLVNASAIGYYGDRPPTQPMTEDAAPAADGFMPELVRDWERATAPAVDAGTRVVLLRFGLVLDPEGLLLQGMATATRLGLGAKLGSGAQVFPWTTREEIARVVGFVLEREDLEGPVNVSHPDRVTNEQLVDTLARVLHRPRFLKIPAGAVRLLGDAGDEVLKGAWVVPGKLEMAGYEWRDPSLESALRRLLGR